MHSSYIYDEGFNVTIETALATAISTASSISIHFTFITSCSLGMRPRTRFGGMLTVLCLVLSSSALQILHLADFHLDVDYSVDGDNQHMCHNTTKPSQSRLGPFGDYMCDSPKVGS